MMPGMIMLWSGAVVDIPAGWLLCDGDNGTPDLRNKFIVGAGDTYNPGDNGGASTHTHPFTASPHNHVIDTGAYLEAGTDWDHWLSSEIVSGTTDPASSLPPYHSLCFIMKE